MSSKRVIRRIRKLPEVWLAYVGYAIVPRLPRKLLLCLARSFGPLAYCFSPKARRVASANLSLAFGPSLSKREARHIIITSFESFALVILDIFWFSKDSHHRVGEYVKFDSSADTFLVKRGDIAVTAHLGNWEVLGQAIALKGCPIVSIANPLRNAAVDKIFMGARSLTGQTVIPKKGAIKVFMRKLQEQYKVALLMDQNTRLSDGGIFVDFFGSPATTTRAAALLSTRTKNDIHVLFCTPEEDGTYHAYSAGKLSPPVVNRENRDQVVLELTQQIADLIEHEIRLKPERWLWMYKRWKYIPDHLDHSSYPYYAHRPAKAASAPHMESKAKAREQCYSA